MVKGNICRIEDCNKIITSERSSLCNTHKHRWFKYKSFDNPKPKMPDGFIQFCGIHGYLTKEMVRVKNRRKCCIKCIKVKDKKSKFIILDTSITERKCGCCKEIKPIESFSPHQNTQRWPICRVCRVNYASASRAKHKYHYRKWYNLTADQYNELLKAQNYRCYICNRTADEAQPGKKNKRENNLSVDHCHELEKQGIMAIRGLLCFPCNIALGKFNDNITILKKAIEYLDRDPVLITKQ